MGRLGIQSWTLALCVILSWTSVAQTETGPQYMVAIPAAMEAGSEAKFCASLLKPNETLVMTVTLMSNEKNTTLLQETSSKEFHSCVQFKTPSVVKEEVQKLEVVVQGETFYSREVRRVMFKAYQSLTFVQTDKPIYLPGQTVHFRVVSMDSKFRPANVMYSVVELEDANRNRIGQWLNKTSDGKILQLSHALNSEARVGFYNIRVSIDEHKISHRFKVEKYVLPKFDAKLTAPEEVCVVQEDFSVEVCAKYTYGQPVPGSAKIKVCRPFQQYGYSVTLEFLEGLAAPCYEETKQTDKTGCSTFTIKMSDFKKFDIKVVQDHLQISAEVEEEGTGVSYQQEARVQITYVIGKFSFEDTPKIYQQGSNIEGKVKAVHHNDTPIADIPLYLFEGDRWSSSRPLQNLTTDSDGTATFSISTTGSSKDYNLYISEQTRLENHYYRTPHYEIGEHTVSLAQTSTPDVKSVSSLNVEEIKEPLPCDKEVDISIQYTVVGEAAGTADVMYLVLGKGVIIMQGVKQVEVKDQSVTEGELSFKLTVSPEMAPDIQVVAYAVLPSETVVAHSRDFPTEKCFSNKVSLEFSPSSAVPGELSSLQMTAEPNSLCGVSAVDQSVLIKEPGKTLEAEKVFQLLSFTKGTHIPYEVQDPVECLYVRPRRYVLPYPGRGDKDDAFTVFQNIGLKMATNIVIRVPTCLKFKGREYHQGYGISLRYHSTPGIARMDTHMVGMAGPGGSYPPPPPPMETVRTFFPETWIWDLVEVGASGTKDMSLTVPDTITTWETEAFCMSPQGFGLAPRKKLTVFQPFFLELTLPYSIIRGEHFELKATVFNYQSSCFMVSVTPTPSLDYTLVPLNGQQYMSCLCGNERKTHRWTMKPSILGVVNVTVSAEAVASHASCDNEIVNVPARGRIDVVTRSLIVKPEGTEKTKTYNWLLCPKGETLTEETEIQLPADMIAGSAVASLSVLGDILGRALKNLNGLLQMPYGCGEQNMALLAPNIYILQYLKNTEQLTPAIMEKATRFLTSGYQRQLNYKHSDGAYSTFGTGAGNTWLTAFVLRSFAKAQAFIYIDPAKIDESKAFLIQKQRSSGCFEKLGKLFNNRMKGGVSDEVTLSAYITAAFLEMGTPVDDPTVMKSLSCLKESISDRSNTYTTALLAYVFTLAGDMDARDQLLQHLDKVSIQQGGFRYWSQEAKDSAASLSVEITSYVLLAKLSSSPTTEDLGYAAHIIRWLTGQQNYYGGFSSTQDTVVALQALALYSTLVFSPEGSSTVTVQSPSGPVIFDVNQDNKLLYQEKLLQDITGKYKLEVKGTACASMQISLRYNIPTPTEVTTLRISAKSETSCSSTSQRPKVLLKMEALYSGKENITNMMILDIKVLSGFAPSPRSLEILKDAGTMVDRVEKKDDHILVYLEQLVKDLPVSYSLEFVQEVPVQDLKPAVVRLYDYYDPSDQAETQYSFPCVSGVLNTLIAIYQSIAKVVWMPRGRGHRSRATTWSTVTWEPQEHRFHHDARHGTGYRHAVQKWPVSELTGKSHKLILPVESPHQKVEVMWN
ncbi:alpha-2-macroglobulin-like protein 1 [Aulostomus maculatus]